MNAKNLNCLPNEIQPGHKLIIIKDEIEYSVEVIGVKEQNNEFYFYVHYPEYNRRLDEWIPFNIIVKWTKEQKKKGEEETGRIKNVDYLYFAGYLIEAWYFSPYPQREVEKRCKEEPFELIPKDFSSQSILTQEELTIENDLMKRNIPSLVDKNVIYVCEYCLFYFGSFKILNQHECGMRRPPGNKIYSKNGLSFYEVDGHMQQNYCRNLSLLSKLFLDHKTLYYDIDVFMFYVLTRDDSLGSHVVGYFSKEKQSEHGYNLACILTLPHCQRMGYGKVLIDFSYLLSRRDKKIASPEKPLSDLGLLSYRAYWTEVIVDLLKNVESISIKAISNATGISEDDITNALCQSNILYFYDSEPCFVIDDSLIHKSEKVKKYRVDESCLVYDQNIEELSD